MIPADQMPANYILGHWTSPLADARGYSDDHLKMMLSYHADRVDHLLQAQLVAELMAKYADVSRRLEEKNRRLLISETGLREAQRIAQLGNWAFRIADQTLWFSDELCEILELPQPPAMTFERYLSKVHPGDFEAAALRLENLRSGAVPSEHKHRLRMADGRIKWAHMRYMVVRGQDGTPLSVRGTLQDITQVKQIEEQLKSTNDHLEALVNQKVEEITASQTATIHALVKLAESRDDDTGDHIERTSGYCRLIAEKLREAGMYLDEIDDQYAENMAKAGPLHDVGKVGIPDAILLKRGPLTAAEFEIMKTHVTLGYETLASVQRMYPANAFLTFGMKIARYHHERWDGRGYVEGLSGEAIPLPARIMALADVYDALRSKRVYKPPFSHERAVQIITEGRANHFDPAVVDVFLKHHPAFQQIFDHSIAQAE